MVLYLDTYLRQIHNLVEVLKQLRPKKPDYCVGHDQVMIKS